jgi:5-methylcytosine-specific restriction endonuclease McrA
MANRVPEDKRSKCLQYYHANKERLKVANRERAMRYYYENKAKKLEANAQYRKDNPDKWKAIKKLSNKKYNKRRFFFVRAAHACGRLNDYSNIDEVTLALSRAWYNQRGRCAYTGKKLDRTAQVDHKIPASRGGTNDSSNLHWVCAEANFVKRDRTHDEFISICSDIAEYIRDNTPKGLLHPLTKSIRRGG